MPVRVLANGARGSARRPRPATPTRISCVKRSGRRAAIRPATCPPNEKPARRSGWPAANSWSTPAAMASAMLAGVRGSGGMAKSPRPGMSGTHSSKRGDEHRDRLDPVRPRAGAAVQEDERLAGAPYAPDHAAVAAGRAQLAGGARHGVDDGGGILRGGGEVSFGMRGSCAPKQFWAQETRGRVHSDGHPGQSPGSRDRWKSEQADG